MYSGKDSMCSAYTPVILGGPETSVYGKGVSILPTVPGRQATKYEQSIYLEKLLPLEEYGLIIVLLSGGKDSAAAYYRLVEMGVPKDKIECWHHDIDGGHPSRRMDWPVTQAYVRAFAEAEGVKLRTSWRVGGFFGELYRVGAALPIEYEDGGGVKTCRLSPAQIRSEELRERILRGLDAGSELARLGYRMKFPAKSGDLARRWCSAYLKIIVSDTVIRNMSELAAYGPPRHKFPAKASPLQGRYCSGSLKAQVQDGVTFNLEPLRQDVKILIVSGERRGESAGRASYNEMEIHRTNATAKARRLVHQWRAVIDHSERDVWEILRRHRLNPHPAYTCGWGRCSCSCCVFSLPKHWAGIKELLPDTYRAFREDEIRLGFTLDNKKNLDEYIAGAASCVDHSDGKAIKQLVTGKFSVSDLYCKPAAWRFPSGAFQGGKGGPC
jgi:3'-phosphoadenosine 5'-phosphosulfate sulfotransferase (PAPS reductase)/FAD synthetase